MHNSAHAGWTAPTTTIPAVVTNHRADGPARGMRGWLLGALLVVLVVVAAVVIGVRVLGGGSSAGGGTPSAAPSSGTTPSPSATTTPPASASTTPSATPSSKPSSKPHLPSVAPSAPDHLTIGSLVDAGFADAVTVTGSRLIPPVEGQVSRLGDRGLPGSPGTDTVVLVGADTGTGGAFDHLDGVKVGATIELRSHTGTLTYTLRSRTSVAPDKVLGLDAVKAKATDRLVIDVAHYQAGNRVGDDLVLVAVLTAAS